MKFKLRSDTEETSPTSITKNTNGDKINAIRNEIRYLFKINSITEHAYYEDHDDNYIFFSMWSEADYNDTYWKIGYTYDGVAVTITEDEASQGVMQKQWKDFPKEEENIEKAVASYIDKAIHKILRKPIIKQYSNDEEMIAIEPLFSVIGEIDLHGDLATEEATRQLVTEFNKAVSEGYMQAGLFHKHKTDSFYYKEAWLVESDSLYEDTMVKAGTPLVELQFTNKKAWELKKANRLMPPSIGAQGNVEDIIND